MSGSDIDVAARVERLGPWFHNLRLPDGRGGTVQTCPGHPFGDFPRFKWDQIAGSLPGDLAGRRCLDVGTNSGFYAFELARRGGGVLGIDLDDHYLAQAAFARGLLGFDGQIELQNRQVYSLASVEERFDVIVFMGVFYHLRYPLLGLDVVSRLLADGGTMVFQTLTMPGGRPMPEAELKGVGFERRGKLAEDGWPRMAFFEHGFSGDPTNWWAADDACCESMLRSCGLRVVDRPGHEMYVCERDPSRETVAPHLREAEYRAALTGLIGGE